MNLLLEIVILDIIHNRKKNKSRKRDQKKSQSALQVCSALTVFNRFSLNKSGGVVAQFEKNKTINWIQAQSYLQKCNILPMIYNRFHQFQFIESRGQGWTKKVIVYWQGKSVVEKAGSALRLTMVISVPIVALNHSV